MIACFPVKIRGASAGWTRAVAIIDWAGGDGSGDGGSRRRRQKNGRAHVRTRKDATSRTTNDQYIIRRPFAERGGKMTNSEIVRGVIHKPPFLLFDPTPFRRRRPGAQTKIEINSLAVLRSEGSTSELDNKRRAHNS